MRSDNSQKDDLDFLSSSLLLKPLSSASAQFSSVEASVNLKMLSYFQKLYCCGSFHIPTHIFVRLVSGQGTGDDFFGFNDRPFLRDRANGYYNVLQGCKPKEKWCMMQSPTMHMMLSKSLPEIQKMIGAERQEEHFLSKSPFEIGRLVLRWIQTQLLSRYKSHDPNQETHRKHANLLIPIAGQHRAAAFVSYMNGNPNHTEWVSQLGESIELRLWLKLPQKVAKTISGVRCLCLPFMENLISSTGNLSCTR